MPTFTPPTRQEGSSDPFWGRYTIPVGISVVRGVSGFGMGGYGEGGYGVDDYEQRPYPSLVELDGLVEGVDWFQGGRTYTISDEIAEALESAGFEVVPDE